MKAILKNPGENPRMVEIPNELGALQQAVGGDIESIMIATDLAILLDEESIINGKRYNLSFCGQPFCGTILLVGVDGEEFADIPDVDQALHLIHATRYACEDKRANSWHCRTCGHQEQFEADGPYENGWDYCPHCGRMLLEPKKEV